MEENDRNIELLRKRLHLKAFCMMFEMAAVIAVPALLVVGVGTYVGVARGTIITFLVVAFVLSWFIIIIRVRQLGRELKSLDARLKAGKE